MKLQPPKRLEVSDDAIGWSVHVDDGVHVVSEVEIWPEDVLRYRSFRQSSHLPTWDDGSLPHLVKV
jgi:hypothetical protein